MTIIIPDNHTRSLSRRDMFSTMPFSKAMTHLQSIVKFLWNKKQQETINQNQKQQQQKAHNLDPINLNLKVVSGSNQQHDSSEKCLSCLREV